MKLQPLAIAVIAGLALSACVTSGPKKPSVDSTPITFTEPELSAPFYALNPFNYNEPPPFETNLQKAAAQPITHSSNSTAPNIIEVNRLIIPLTNQNTRNMTFAVINGDNQIDITEIDDFLQLVEGKARHYPPRFTDRQERRGYENKLRKVTGQLDTLAANDNASFDVLIRAFKASVMARNLDLGSVYTGKSLTYAQRILKINQSDAEANFWFGFALSEGGGQREAIPYLDKAMKADVQEAYLAAANNYLAMERKKDALKVLKTYKAKYPQEAEVTDRLILEIEKQGRWNVWQVLTPKP